MKTKTHEPENIALVNQLAQEAAMQQYYEFEAFEVLFGFKEGLLGKESQMCQVSENKVALCFTNFYCYEGMNQ